MNLSIIFTSTTKNIIENIPDMQDFDVLRILNRFMSEHAFYDEDRFR